MTYQSMVNAGTPITGEMLTSYMTFSILGISSRQNIDVLNAAVKTHMGDWVTADGWTIKRTIRKRSDWDRFTRDIKNLQETLGITHKKATRYESKV